VPHTLHHPSSSPARLTDAVAARQLVDLAISRPLRSETVVFLADDSHLGHTCFIVSGTSAVDDVLDVAALVVEVAERSPAVHAVVLATVRPGTTRTVAATWRPGHRAVHHVAARVDPRDRITESNERDNRLSRTFRR